jgi:hypothetical protein
MSRSAAMKFFTFIGALYHHKITATVGRLQMLFQRPQLPSPLATLSMVTAFYFQLVHLSPDRLIDDVMEVFSLSSTVRTHVFAFYLEPLIQTGLAKDLTAAHG